LGLLADPQLGNAARKTLEAQIAKRALQEPEEGPKNVAEERLRGVGGWLILIIFGMVVGSPLATLVNLSQWWSVDKQLFTASPGFRTWMVVDIVSSLAVSAVGVYAGLALWTVRPKAVVLAKTALLFVFGYAILTLVMPFFMALPHDIGQGVTKDLVPDVVRMVLVAVIWFSYLSSSKRVRVTYRAS
jgi:hypothetical protein